MAQKKDDMPKVSLTNTKKEMLEAFNELKQKFKEKEETQLQPEKKKEEKHAAEVIRTADALTADGAAVKINDLKSEIGKMLSQLSDKMEDEAANYLKLKESIELKKNELKEIYDIEAAAHALAALIEAQKQKRESFDEEMTAKKDALETEITQQKQAWEKEKKAHEENLKERDTEEKKRWERKKEEFEYNFNREKQLRQNAFKDEKEKTEKELTASKENFEKETAEREKNLNEREEKVKERETFIDELQKQVDTFPGRLEAELKKAVQDVTERLTDEAKKNEELLTKEYEGEKNVLKTKIDSLESTVAEQAKQITALSTRLETSYNKVQDIAVKAIEGSSAAQHYNRLEQHLIDRKTTPPPEPKTS
jgi:hypothetical protein